MQTCTILPADAEMAIDDTGATSGDAMPYGADFAELFDVEMDQFTRVLALITMDGLGGSNALSLFNPNRRRMRLTVAAEMPSSVAICRPV